MEIFKKRSREGQLNNLGGSVVSPMIPPLIKSKVFHLPQGPLPLNAKFLIIISHAAVLRGPTMPLPTGEGIFNSPQDALGPLADIAIIAIT